MFLADLVIRIYVSGSFICFIKTLIMNWRGGVMISVEREHRSSSNFDHQESQKLFGAPEFFGAVLSVAAIATFVIGLSHTAQALPSYARQTGQPCGTCHTDYHTAVYSS
jgi:hypothetical protein